MTPDTPSVGEKRPQRKKPRRQVATARVCITAGYNNTIVTFTDPEGNVLTTASAGSCGFAGTRKSTPYAAKVAAEAAAERAKAYGVERVTVEIRGAGPGRDQAIRGLQGAALDFQRIVDRTPVAHGGVRPHRRRRV